MRYAVALAGALLCGAVPLSALGQAAGPSAVDPGHLLPGDRHPARLTGDYDGSAPEVAAHLRLLPGGRFTYALSYGAIDEVAEGDWTFDGTAVRLTSDPLRAPAFRLTGQRTVPEPELRLELDLPRGILRQYFDAKITLADGTLIRRPFTEDGLVLPLAPEDRVVAVVIGLAVYDLASAAAVPVVQPGQGAVLDFRFDPNDLGRAELANVPAAVQAGDLAVERHGRVIRFRRQG